MSKPSRSLFDLVLVVCGKGATVGVIFLGGVLLARTGSPAQYGIFATGMTLILLIDGMIGSPLDLGVVRFAAGHSDCPSRIQQYEAFTLHLKWLLGLIVFGLWALISGDPLQAGITVGIALALLSVRSLATGLQIRERFQSYTLLDVIQGSARLLCFGGLAAGGVSAGMTYLGAYGVVAVVTFFSAVGFFKQAYLFGRWPSLSERKNVLAYCGLTSGIVALGTITGRGDLLLLSHWFGEAQSAQYAAASQLFLLLAQLSFYLSVVTQPKIWQWTQQGTLQKAFLVNLGLVLVLFIPATALVFYDLPLRWFLTLLFGSQYQEAASLFKILMFGGLLDLLIVPVLMMTVLQTAPAAALYCEALITLLFVGAALWLLPRDQPFLAQKAMALLAVILRLLKGGVYYGLFRRALRLQLPPNPSPAAS